MGIETTLDELQPNPLKVQLRKMMERGGPGIYRVILNEHHAYDMQAHEIIPLDTLATLPQRVVNGYYEGLHDQETFTLKASFVVPLKISYNILTNAERMGDLPPQGTPKRQVIVSAIL